jgi:capsular exopolysaccharide synthesis family protein
MLPTLPLQPDQRQLMNSVYSSPAPAKPTLGAFTSVLRRHRLLFGLCLAVAVVLGAAYTALATRVYEATSILRFEVEQVNLPQLVRLLSTENLIGTEIEVLRGRLAAAGVIDSLGLRAKLAAPGRGRTSELFSVLRVAPGTDAFTLLVRAQPGGQFTISRPDLREEAILARVRDTVHAWGVTLALTPAAQKAGELRLEVVSPEEAARDFESALKVSRPALGADLIALRVRSSDPVQAAAAANILAQQLISGRQSVQLARTGSTVRFLKQQLDTLGIQLRAAEERLRAYREKEGVVDVEEAARTQVRRLAQIQADRGAVEAERQALSSLVAQMRSDSARGGQALSRGLISFPTLFRNAAASELLGALAQVENQRSALLVRRKPEDPDVQVLTGRVRELDAQLQGIAETYLQGLTNQVAALQDVARGFGGALDSLPRKEVRTARLEREVKVQQELYTLIQTRLKEAEITRAMEDPTVRVAESAVVPDRPVRPNVALNLGLSLVLGSLLGMVGAFGREMTDRSVRTRGDVLLAAGLPVLGAAPRLQLQPIKFLPGAGRHRRHVHHRHQGRLQRAARRLRRVFGRPGGSERYAAARIQSLLVTRAETSAAYAEAFNHLHANLVLAHQESPPKILVFTSPLPGEGKTLSTINFALTLAGRGLRVLLIDADLRCGLVNEVFGYARQPGFAELLNGSVRFEDAAQRVSVGETGSLLMLPSGEQFPKSGKGLKLERVREVLEGLASEFDIVLVDSPPVNLLADAALLGSAADGVVLVVRAGHTRIDALRYAMEQLTTARAPVLGTLLNDIDLRQLSYDDSSYGYLTEVERYYAVRS